MKVNSYKLNKKQTEAAMREINRQVKEASDKINLDFDNEKGWEIINES